MISFFVPGIPRPGGSKKGFVNKKTGGVILVDAGGKSTAAWKDTVRLFAAQKYTGLLLEGPLYLWLNFYMPRPKKHYHTGKRAAELKDDAPMWHTIAPDADKSARTVLDALKGVLYRDDAQVASLRSDKFYAEKPGVHIVICELGP